MCVCVVCAFVRLRTCAWVQFKCDVTDDCLLQDEPLQLRIFDYDVLSSDDVIGTVCYAPRPMSRLPVSSLSVALARSLSLSLSLALALSRSRSLALSRARALSLSHWRIRWRIFPIVFLRHAPTLMLTAVPLPPAYAWTLTVQVYVN